MNDQLLLKFPTKKQYLIDDFYVQKLNKDYVLVDVGLASLLRITELLFMYWMNLQLGLHVENIEIL